LSTAEQFLSTPTVVGDNCGISITFSSTWLRQHNTRW